MDNILKVPNQSSGQSKENKRKTRRQSMSVDGITPGNIFRRKRKPPQNSDQRSSDNVDGQTLGDSDNSSNSRKPIINALSPDSKKGRFRSLDFRRYTPKRLFFMGQQPDRIQSLRRGTAFPQQITRSGSYSQHSQLSLPRSTSPTTPNTLFPSPAVSATTTMVPSPLIKFELVDLDLMKNKVFSFKVLDAMFNEQGTELRCKFVEKELMYNKDPRDSPDQYEKYDDVMALLLLDIGHLHPSKPYVFQLNSAKNGIMILEALSSQDKHEFISLLSNLKSLDGSLGVAHDGTHTQVEDSDRFDYINSIGAADFTPALFMEWNKKHLEEYFILEADVEDKDKELDSLLQHMRILRKNVDHLSEDISNITQNTSQHKKNMQKVKDNADRMKQQLETLKRNIIEKKDKDVRERFPQKLKQIEDNIQIWQQKHKQRYTMSIVLISGSAIISLIFLWLIARVLSIAKGS